MRYLFLVNVLLSQVRFLDHGSIKMTKCDVKHTAINISGRTIQVNGIVWETLGYDLNLM